MTKCRICGNNKNNTRHSFQENYLGLKDEFEYIECNECKSLSIVNIPEDMSRYYPVKYYSYTIKPYNRISGFFKGKRDRYYLGKKSFTGLILSLVFSPPPYIKWLKVLRVGFGANILDVGCGSGTLVTNLLDAGFAAIGIDKFIREPIEYPNGAKVLNISIKEVEGSFDCIMLHHSFEHMPDPSDIFQQINRLLKKDGKVLIRTPIADKKAWKIYKKHWFQIDAPRHFLIPSENGINKLSKQFGFKIFKVIYDSTASQFWGSEQYANSIAHLDKRSFAVNPDQSSFTTEAIKDYSQKAKQLNMANEGDQAAFFLCREGCD